MNYCLLFMFFRRILSSLIPITSLFANRLILGENLFNCQSPMPSRDQGWLEMMLKGNVFDGGISITSFWIEFFAVKKGFEKMMMKGGKDEAKVMNPMFPRLHVNDAEKGGPKAPPRNKMALYEQLSITSRRFNSGSQSMLPFPPNNSNILVPSMPSSHVSFVAF